MVEYTQCNVEGCSNPRYEGTTLAKCKECYLEYYRQYYADKKLGVVKIKVCRICGEEKELVHGKLCKDCYRESRKPSYNQNYYLKHKLWFRMRQLRISKPEIFRLYDPNNIITKHLWMTT